MKPLKALGLCAFVAALAAFPIVVPNPYYIHLLVVIGIYVILLYGLDIVVGYTGEISLGHAGLFGIGAYAAGLLFVKAGLPFWIVLPAAMLITAAIGMILAIPALRVTGPYLAMVTLAFGTIVAILINEMDFLTNGPQGLQVLKPKIFGHQTTAVEFYYFTLVLVFLCTIAVSRLLRSHFGRAFIALRGSPIAADCMGVSVYRYKVIAFAVSAALAGLSGGLFAFSEEYIAPSTFNFELAVLFLLALTLGGRKSRAGAVIGAAIVIVLPNLLSDVVLFRTLAVAIAIVAVSAIVVAVAKARLKISSVVLPSVAIILFLVFAFTLRDISEHRLTIFGLMILGVVFYLPDGVMGFVRTVASKLGLAVHADDALRASNEIEPDALESRTGGASDEGPLLEAKRIVMQFGGLKALNEVDLVVKRGSVHGIIGPNGSGKSTMMNVLTGIYEPTAGERLFLGKTMDGLSSSQIALGGVARTFQNVQLFGDMSSTENILVGLHHTFESNILDVILNTPRFRREERSARQRAASLLGFVGLDTAAAVEARHLPYGRMRLLEIARALALGPRILLLDEPAAGLPPSGLPDLISIIKKIREHGITVILIEHHMDVVMSLCDRVTVLDFGQKIAEGTGSEVRSDPKVIEAYLGSGVTQDAEIESSAGSRVVAPC